MTDGHQCFASATLWRTYGAEAGSFFGGKGAAQLLEEATGLEPEDFLAIGFALTSHAMQWMPSKPILVRLDDGLAIPKEKIETFVHAVCTTLQEIVERISSEDALSTWDFLPFQTTPVLALPDGYLVLDETFLWDRITSGLFWMVFDHLKGIAPNDAELRWTQAWASIVEVAVGDSLRSCAVPTLDGSPAFFTEDDLHKAYGNNVRAADFVLDGGEMFGAFEVVSGRVATGTRIALAREAFDRDIERLVMNKVRQLHSTATCLLGSEEPLTGQAPSFRRHVLPVVVSAMGFPYMEPVILHIRDSMRAEGLLQDARVEPLCIVDLRELELLEGVVASGGSVASSLLAWQRATDGRISLWDWTATRPGPRLSRAPRIASEGKKVVNELRSRLKIGGDNGDPWEFSGPSDQ